MFEDILVSIIMAVHNEKEEYLKEAIASILNQTYTNLEFIIIDDCSNETTQRILGDVKDERIKIYRNQTNIGLTKSLNIALTHCNGKYIARMDADDVSYEKRIEKQLLYMETHSQVGVVGCWTSNNINNKVKHWQGNTSTEWRRVAMLFGNYGICHPTAFIRKSILDENNITYNNELKKAQDYDLWLQLIEVTDMAVMPECLLMYRVHEGQITNANRGEQLVCRDKIQIEYINKVLTLDDSNANIIISINYENVNISDVCDVFEQIEKESRLRGCRLNSIILRNELVRQWTECCFKKADNKTKAIFNKYFISILKPSYLFWRVKLYWHMKIA